MNPFAAALNKIANEESPGKTSSSVPNNDQPSQSIPGPSTMIFPKVARSQVPIKQVNLKGRPKKPKAKKPKGKQTRKVSEVVMDLKLKDSFNDTFDILVHIGTWDDMTRAEVRETVLEPEPQRSRRPESEAPVASGSNPPLIYNEPNQTNKYKMENWCKEKTIFDVMNWHPDYLNFPPASSFVRRPRTPYLFALVNKHKKTKWTQINNVNLISIGGLSARSFRTYNLELWTLTGTARRNVGPSQLAENRPQPKVKKKKEKKIKPDATPTVSFSMMAHLMMKYGEDYDKNLQQMETVLKSSDYTEDVLLENPAIKPLPQKQKKSKKRHFEIVHQLRVDYIREHNMKLKRIEEKLNGTSKVTISLEKFYLTEKGDNFVKTYPNPTLNSELLQNIDLIPYSNLWLISKHEQCLTKNILKIFPDFHLQMPKATVGRDFNFDPITADAIRAVARNSTCRIVGEGKEAVILHACSKEAINFRLDYAFKVFKLTANSGRNVYLEKYERCELVENRSFRKYGRLWAEKEKNNLKRMRAAGIPCPKVFRLKQNVLMTSFIGTNGRPAPKLKDAVMTNDGFLVAYKQIIGGMELLHKSGLVHADLSENNVLLHDGRCYFIDVSQSVTYEHKHALKFLYRDCNNITKFFFKKQILNQPTADELFCFITGQPYEVKTRGKAKKNIP